MAGDAASDAAATARSVAALAEWAASVRWRDIPDRSRRRAAIVLMDDIAAMVAARDEPELRRLHDRMLRRSGPAEATVFRGGRERTDRHSAAVANGAAIDWCELDEGYRMALCHAGVCILPALLAEAEAEEMTTVELLRALAVSYEVVTRFARAFPPSRLTLHPHGSLAAVGAAAAIAAARGYDAAAFARALSTASSMVGPAPFNHTVKGALVRNVWPAAGAWCGMRAAEWSEFGITGLPEAPWHVFVENFGTECHPDAMTAKLGTRWAVDDGYHKIHACCQYAHSAVDATLDLLASLPADRHPQEVELILVETHWRGRALDNPAQATSLAARFSMPHIAAATALMGHAGAEAFAADTLADPAIARLRGRVEVAAFEPEMPPPNDRPARVTWIFGDGQQFAAECLSARGGPDRPFGVEEILAKIGTIGAPVYPDLRDVAARLIDLDEALLDETWNKTVTRITGRH